MDFMNSFGVPGILTVDALTFNRQGVDWDDEWKRCSSLGQTDVHRDPCGPFVPGSIQGIWEGIFTVRDMDVCRVLSNQGPTVHGFLFVC